MGSALGPWAKAKLVNSDVKECSFGKLHGDSFLRGMQEKGTERSGRLLTAKAAGESYLELKTFTCDSVDGYLEHALVAGLASISARTLQATWPHRMNVELVMLQSSLAQLSTPDSFQISSLLYFLNIFLLPVPIWFFLLL